ncbi:hypothetical protein [Spirillospora sp. NPDC047279]|uniref:hypothetical protein n=1 Tax=Spirillospora sp. NPDC047279 TaxID=3155478 RepID=UPI0033FDE09D
MTRLFVAASPAGLLAMTAALDAGLLAGRGRRILLLAGAAPVPGQAPALGDVPGFAALARRYDEVIDLAAEIAPLHPAGWSPPAEELPLFARLLRRAWGLGGGPVELVTESVARHPGRALSLIFHDAPLTVCTPDLTAYGPTMEPLPPGVGGRIRALVHLDLVPGLAPLLLAEYGIDVEVIAEDAWRGVAAELSPPVLPPETAVILGPPEDARCLDMVRGAVGSGHSSVVFVPCDGIGPGTAPGSARRLAEEAARLGARLVVAEQADPPDLWFAGKEPPALVAGASGGPLLRAARLFGLPVACAEAGRLLDRLPRYEHPDRVPLTLLDAALPELTSTGEMVPPPAVELRTLIPAIAYCMRATVHAGLRRETEAYLTEIADGPLTRYFSRTRLDELRLLMPPPEDRPPPSEPSPRPSGGRLGARLRRRPTG